MKFTDTKIGMKIKRIGEDHKDVKKGSVYTIEKAHCGGVSLKGMGDYWYDLDLFEPVVMELEQSKDEPVNKFEVGDEVIFKEYEKQYKAEIFGLTRNKTKEVASIKFESDNEYHFRIILDIDFYLSPLKNKDELEVGDKFVSYSTDHQMYKILSVEFDEHLDDKVYIAKTISEYHYGKIRVLDTSCVKEIIYD